MSETRDGNNANWHYKKRRNKGMKDWGERKSETGEEKNHATPRERKSGKRHGRKNANHCVTTEHCPPRQDLVLIADPLSSKTAVAVEAKV